jgi:hypothetical protein
MEFLKSNIKIFYVIFIDSFDKVWYDSILNLVPGRTDRARILSGDRVVVESKTLLKGEET